MPILSSITDLIGNTPMLELGRYCADVPGQVLAKLEMCNPISMKDRPVWHMILGAEERGDLSPGAMIVEATSGNTGMAAAYIGGMRGYPVTLFMSEAQSIERRSVLAALGATIVLTPASEGTLGAKERAVAFAAKTEGSFYLCQHHNLDNRRAHFETTGPEIYRDTEGKVDIIVAGLGTCGTLCGISAFLKSQNTSVVSVGVEPAAAPMISSGTWAQHGIMGLSPGFVPDNLDRSLVDEIVTVTEEEAYQACRQIAKHEGLLVGISGGANAHVARKLAEREENAGKCIVCVFPDTGERYLSVSGLFSPLS